MKQRNLFGRALSNFPGCGITNMTEAWRVKHSESARNRETRKRRPHLWAFAGAGSEAAACWDACGPLEGPATSLARAPAKAAALGDWAFLAGRWAASGGAAAAAAARLPWALPAPPAGECSCVVDAIFCLRRGEPPVGAAALAVRCGHGGLSRALLIVNRVSAAAVPGLTG